MNSQNTNTKIFISIIAILVIIVIYFAYVSYQQFLKIKTFPAGVAMQTPPLSYEELYPIATTSTYFGGWDSYENTKYQYKIAYPRQLFIEKQSLPDQSTTTNSGVQPSSNKEKWDVIHLERSNGDTLLVYLTIEAWGPDTVIQDGGGYIRMGSMELRPLVEELNNTWASYEGVSPLKIEEIKIGGTTGYKINEGSRSKIFTEYSKTKFIITFNNDPVSEMIANSIEFTGK